jgi:transmembrane 9 superfamily protein 3
MLGGVLPFGSIFIEAFFVFQSFWLYKFYSVFKFLFLVFVILILVSLCVTVVTTYFLLNAEEYRWQWLSFFSSASTAVYVFLYAAYFYVAKTQMSGFFQTVFYFGYMSLCCLALGLLCGTVGFCGSAIFVQAIYSRVKSD